MKFTKVTDQNLHLIKYRMEQFVKRHNIITDTWHYPTQKLRNNKLPADSNERHAERSIASTYFGENIKIELANSLVDGKRFIRITYDSQNASRIRVGDKVKMTSTHVTQICEHPTMWKENAKIIFKSKSTK